MRHNDRVTTPHFGQANRVVIIGGRSGWLRGGAGRGAARRRGDRRRQRRPRRLGGGHRLRAEQDADRDRRADDRARRSARARASASRTTRATPPTEIVVDLARVNDRVKKLAADQSADIGRRLEREDVQVVRGPGAARRPRHGGRRPGGRRDRDASRPTPCSSPPAPRPAPCRPPSRTASGSSPGSRSTTSPRAPTKLVVVGSGVTGAEFASAYMALGIEVVLVSSRDRVLPGRGRRRRRRCSRTCSPAAAWRCCPARGWSRSTRDGDEVTVTLTDGRTVDRIALPARARLGAEDRRPRARGRRGDARRRRLRHGRPRLTDHRPRGVRRRRLHRRADARQRGRDAGPDRDVALPRRRRHPARPQAGLLQRLHGPRDRDGRLVAEGGRRGRDRGRGRAARPRRATRAPRCRACTTAS